PARAREVFDVSGAGDTVVAALAAALAVGAPVPLAARLANVAAGIVVGKTGTAVARADEIVGVLHEGALHDAEEKVASTTSAVERVDAWRRRGLRIGFTNGCFDLLHPGHISLLRQARDACDRLVVGLNGDESVRRLKGENRPVQDAAARTAVIASLASVDLVVIFHEDTPIDLINSLKPDLLVKGADYAPDKVVGAPEVQSWGGELLLAEIVEDQSTTDLIEKAES
ncbi:MAG: D-glycero-beta-D-manno-heptose 1-phosphate adenylyltransferase, partial [Alphaproteobacteria bacterium]